MITQLKPNQIFVFGSNLAGRHGAGAAKQAHRDFGAIYGVGEGLTGQCYALPTLDRNLDLRTHSELVDSVFKFVNCASRMPEYEFLLTKVGCGLAGYAEEYMRDFFINMPSNVTKPEGW